MRALPLAVILGGALLVGAFLRFDGLGEPSFWMDEILHQRITNEAAGGAWWRWIAGVEAENGPLYYATQLVTRVGGTGEAAARSAAALFGLATIAVVFLIARRDPDASVAAILLAVSPLHVYYSREARPYALLMLLTAAMIAILLRGRSVSAALAVLVAMAFTAAVSAPVIAATAVVAIAMALLDRERRKFFAIAGGAALVLAALLPFYYGGAAETHIATQPPAFDLAFFDALVRNFSVTALASPDAGRAAYVVLLLAIAGAVQLVRRDRRAGVVVIGMAVLPLAIALGALAVFDRWYAVRYVAPSLVGYLLLAGFGIAAIARAFRQLAPLVAVSLAIAIAAQAWSACRIEPWQKLDWRAIAETLTRYAGPDDVVIAAEPWSGLMLEFYLPKRVKSLQLSTVPLAQVAVAEHEAAWLVTGGFSTDTSVRSWMCSAPLLLGHPLENFRLHYTSRSGGSFLRERARDAELRAVAASIGTLQMHEDWLLGEGWAGAEGAFRWAASTRATVVIPRYGREERELRMRVMPLDHPSLAKQTMRVSLNGRALETFTLAPGWQDVSVRAPAWKDGLNTLAFDFGRAVAPAELDPANGDARKLAVAFDWIAIDGPHAPPAVAVRLPPLPERKPALATRFPPHQLDRDATTRLLGRIGLDPQTHWPRLASGATTLEDLVETVRYGTDCMDDATFARHAFTLLLGRAPGDAELETLLQVPRERLPGRLAKFDELRAQLF